MEPGDLSAGTYETQWFFGGRMTLTFEEGWTSPEDSTGEFRAVPVGSDYGIDFWEDVYPVEDGHRIKSVPITAKGLLDWFTANPNLVVSTPVDGAIGADLPAMVFDVGISRRAINDDPNCPSVCANPLGFPQWDEPFGFVGNDVRRFYLADVTYGGRTHLFVVMIEGRNQADLQSFLPVAERLIAGVQVPASPA